MLRIRTVLCPIGFDDLDAREVALAADIARAFGARLVLHHNLGTAPPGASMSWMWHQEHRDGRSGEELAAARLRELLATLPPDLEAEASISSGIAGPAILCMEDRAEADLVVMATHGASTADHESIAEQTIECSRCPVLVLRADDDGAEPRLAASPEGSAIRVLVPTDLTAASGATVDYAFDLARTLPLELYLLHVVPPSHGVRVEPGAPFVLPEEARATAGVERAGRELVRLVPEDLKDRVHVEVALGDPAEEIARAAAVLGVSYIVMGAHARSLLRRYFTRDTARELLHQAPCPVWFVPDAQAA